MSSRKDNAGGKTSREEMERLEKLNAETKALIDTILPSREEIATIRSLLDKEDRNQNEWDVIKRILWNNQLITPVPIMLNKTCQNFGDMLYYEDRLTFFSTMEDCQEFCTELLKKEPNCRYMNYRSYTFGEIVEMSQKIKRDVIIDPGRMKEGKRTLYFSPRTNRIVAAMTGSSISSIRDLMEFMKKYPEGEIY